MTTFGWCLASGLAVSAVAYFIGYWHAVDDETKRRRKGRAS